MEELREEEGDGVDIAGFKYKGIGCVEDDSDARAGRPSRCDGWTIDRMSSK